jgi:thymidylate synthase (FAD)
MSANSISGRYVDFSDDYFYPTELRKQSTDSKQGSAGIIENPELLAKMHDHINESKELYRELCDAGVAKEEARIILPLALQTEFIWTGSLLSFIHLWDLRLSPSTQLETRQLAHLMLNELQQLDGNPFEATLEIFDLSNLTLNTYED